MRKPVLYAMIAAVVLLAGATAVFVQKYAQASLDYSNMKSAEESARSQYADAFSAIAEIQDSLSAIALGDQALPLVSQGLQAEERLTQPDKRQALERIALLSASVQRAKEKIGRLESSLKRSHVKSAGLQKIIATLKDDALAKESLLAQLTGRVDSLQTQVAGLQTTVQQDQESLRQRDQTIEEKRHELATVEYLIGTKQDLTASGVVAARGGVLGLGKTLALSGRFNEGLFTPLDTDQQTVVRTSSPRIQVLSPQPMSSYELQVVDGKVEIHILDPAEFRKVRHLVVMTREKA
jgi:peptidoglycan hydrolase CwlO-like protein